MVSLEAILSVKLTGVLNIFSALHCYPIGYLKSLHRYIFFINLPPVEVGHFCGQLESFSGAREITLNTISQKTLGLVRCESKTISLSGFRKFRKIKAYLQLPNVMS